MAAASFDASYLYSQPIKDDPGNEITEHVVAASASGTAYRKPDGLLDLKIGLDVQFNDWEFDERQIPDTRFYKAAIPLTALSRLNPHWILSGTLTPGVYANVEHLEGDDFRLEGNVLATWIKSETFVVLFGLAYGDDFGEPQVYPVGGVMWQATETLHLDLVFPAAKVDWKAFERMHFLADISPSGSQWRWREDDGDIFTQDDLLVRISGYRMGVGAGHDLATGWNVSGLVGMDFGREIEIENDRTGAVGDVELVESAYVTISCKGTF